VEIVGIAFYLYPNFIAVHAIGHAVAANHDILPQALDDDEPDTTPCYVQPADVLAGI
jgi:hypothetical protein